MNNQWKTLIDKLMLWRTNNWTKYDSKSGTFTLHVHYDQLIIVSDSKILESFNMNSKMKGIYKEDILILIVSVAGQEIRKLKFQIKDEVAHCLYKLGEHFPVINHSNLQSKNNVVLKYRAIDEVLKHALEKNESTASVPLPLNYENFIKLCLLDPTFPQMVLETNKILQDGIFKKR